MTTGYQNVMDALYPDDPAKAHVLNIKNVLFGRLKDSLDGRGERSKLEWIQQAMKGCPKIPDDAMQFIVNGIDEENMEVCSMLSMEQCLRFLFNLDDVVHLNFPELLKPGNCYGCP